MDKALSAGLLVVGVIIAVLIGMLVNQNARLHADPELTTPYQAVLLVNGQAYFGKLEKVGTAFPVLRDVYYLRGQMNQETKQFTGTLVKRGNEPHAPDLMNIAADQIVLIEPVKPDSTIGKLIEEGKRQQAAGAPAAPAAPPPPPPTK